MRYIETVWIVDVPDYVDYIERALKDIADKFDCFSWLRSLIRNQQREKTRRVSWRKVLEENPIDQYNELIDWLVAKELDSMYYITAIGVKNATQEHLMLHNLLVNEYDLNRATLHHLVIPKIYSDMFDVNVRRVHNWVYINANVEDNQAKKHALRYKKKGR